MKLHNVLVSQFFINFLKEQFLHAHSDAAQRDPWRETLPNSSTLPKNTQKAGFVAIDETGHHVAEVRTGAHQQQENSQHGLNFWNF